MEDAWFAGFVLAVTWAFISFCIAVATDKVWRLLIVAIGIVVAVICFRKWKDVRDENRAQTEETEES